MTCQTDGCENTPRVCDECVRAIALMFFGGVARHPEQREADVPLCALCELGAVCWCPSCAIDGEHGVIVRRRALRLAEEGYRTGPHAIRVGRDVPDDVTLIPMEEFAELQEAARRGGWAGA